LRQFSYDDILFRIEHPGDNILRNILIMKPNGNTGIFTTAPIAKLHVNGVLEEIPYITNTGNLFVTTGPLGAENSWRMITKIIGGTGPLMEVGKLWTISQNNNVQDFHLQASRGNLVFHSNTNEITGY